MKSLLTTRKNKGIIIKYIFIINKYLYSNNSHKNVIL